MALIGILIPLSVFFVTSGQFPYNREEESESISRASLISRSDENETDNMDDKSVSPAENTSESVPEEGTPEETSDETTKESTSSENTTPEITTPEESASTEDPKASLDNEKRKEALSRYKNLGIVVNAPKYLNMRNIPSLDGEICGVIFPYCGVDILEHTDNGWYKIVSGGTTGYVSDKYIETGEEAVNLGMEHSRYIAEALKDGVSLYSEADRESSVIMKINTGNDFSCVKEGKKWVKVELYENFFGYLLKEEVKTGYKLDDAIAFADANGASQIRRDIINTAFQYYGGKYVFNGTSLTDGIDCSAFTQQIFGKNGISLKRNSWLQAAQGRHIEEAEYRPGDLLFYYGAHTGGIGHVAIYIGNGKVIHAASERMGICVSDFKRAPILEARNVIGD